MMKGVHFYKKFFFPLINLQVKPHYVIVQIKKKVLIMKIDEPKISPLENLTPKNFSDILEELDPEIEGAIITDSDFSNEELERVRLYNTVIKNGNFSNTDFSRIDLTDVHFENCDFSNANMQKASIHRVAFKNCKLLGTVLTDSSIGNVKFTDSILNMAMFGNSKIEKVIFQNGSILNADFYECRFKKVLFDTCQITGTNFIRSPLKGVDISSSHFDTLTVGLENVSGCTVSTHQAIQFASLLGLKIK